MFSCRLANAVLRAKLAVALGVMPATLGTNKKIFLTRFARWRY
jgi:hypothetical protein